MSTFIKVWLFVMGASTAYVLGSFYSSGDVLFSLYSLVHNGLLPVGFLALVYGFWKGAGQEGMRMGPLLLTAAVVIAFHCYSVHLWLEASAAV